MTHEELRGHGDAIKAVAEQLARVATTDAFGKDAPGQWVPGVRVMIAKDHPVIVYHFVTEDMQEIRAPFDARWFVHPDGKDAVGDFFLEVLKAMGEHKDARGPLIVNTTVH